MSDTLTRSPVLMFGMPRSGTTWVGKLLDSHPDVLYRHEPDAWRPLSMPRYPVCPAQREHIDEMRRFVDAMPAIRVQRVAGKRPLFAKRYMSTLRARTLDVAVETARVASRLMPDFPVIGHSDARHHAARCVVWKSINSLGRLGVALEALPEAKGVQLVRHPCGYIASVMRGLSGNSFERADSNSGDFGILDAVAATDLGRRYALDWDYLRSLSSEERLAWRWVLINEKAWRDARDSENYKCVYYEHLCREPEAGTTALFAHCGLDWNKQTADFVAESTARVRDSYYSVYKDPEVSAWRWRDDLAPSVIDRVMAIVERSEIGAPYLTMRPPAARAS